jgi:two-component system response regulator HydG
LALGSAPEIRVADLPSNLLYLVAEPRHDPRALATLQELEQRAILQALEATKGDRLRAARLLGIGKTTIYRKLKEYGLEDVADSPPSC